MVQIISASIANNIQVVIENVPLVDDTYVLMDIINNAGGDCRLEGHRLFCNPNGMKISKIPEHLSEKIHGSLYLMPAYAVRFKKFWIGKTGGCQIGNSSQKQERPVQHMLDIMKGYGIEINVENDFLLGKIENTPPQCIFFNIADFSQSADMLTGSHISGATKTALLLAPLVQKLELERPYNKTDVRDLLRFYQLIGHKVDVTDTTIKIDPVSVENNSCYTFSLTECVSEVMTYFALAIHCGIELELLVKNPDSIMQGLKIEFELLDKMGVQYKINKNSIHIYKTDKINPINIDVTNDSIQSDHLPFFALMLLRAESESILREFVWKERFAYVSELKKLGADLTLDGNRLLVRPSKLYQGDLELKAYDTRSAAITILAALTTKGSVVIHNLHHLYRGYESFIENLNSLGANISPFHKEDLSLDNVA